MKQIIFMLLIASLPTKSFAYGMYEHTNPRPSPQEEARRESERHAERRRWTPKVTLIAADVRELREPIELALENTVKTLGGSPHFESALRTQVVNDLLRVIYSHHDTTSDAEMYAGRLAEKLVAWIYVLSVNASADVPAAAVTEGFYKIFAQVLENQPVHGRKVIIAKLRSALWWKSRTKNARVHDAKFRTSNRRWSNATISHLRQRLWTHDCAAAIESK